MRFELKGGRCRHTQVIFYKDKDGKVRAFPESNTKAVLEEGTEESKARLKKILSGGKIND